jgi:hypothetical protein
MKLLKLLMMWQQELQRLETLLLMLQVRPVTSWMGFLQ